MNNNQNKEIYNENSFSRYIYSNIRSEERYLWGAAVTIMGIFFTALGVIFSNKISYAFSISSQLIFITGVIEIMILSDFNKKRKFLIELEKKTMESLSTNEIEPPYWECWIDKEQFRKFNSYTFALFVLILWSLIFYLWCIYNLFVTKETTSFICSLIIFEAICGCVLLVLLIRDYCLDKSVL